MPERTTLAEMIFIGVDEGDQGRAHAWKVGESMTAREIKQNYPKVRGYAEAIPRGIFEDAHCFEVGKGEQHGRSINIYKRASGPSDEICAGCPFSEDGENRSKCRIRQSDMESDGRPFFC